MLSCFICALICACGEDEIRTNSSQNLADKECLYDRVDEVIWTDDRATWLYGGESDSMHFNITNWNLEGCQLNYGLGREIYKALVETSYTEINKISDVSPTANCLVLKGDGEVRVYPYHILSYHEVVNEYILGEAIAVGYCELADLAVVYKRSYCDTELTFAISGYTYADPFVYNNVQSFVMWDRETESLWWPLIDMGVSGKFKGTEMVYYDQSKWEILQWQQIKELYPNAKVLDLDTSEIPSANYKIDADDLDC